MITTREIRNLILSRTNLNELYKNNRHTPLTLACKLNNLNAVKLLIEADADVNAEDGYGGTAFMCSSIYNYDNISEYLLSKGADINHQIKNKHFGTGCTALMVASRINNYAAVKFIIDHGANINLDRYGRTALFDAVDSDYSMLSIVELLVFNGIDINMQDNNGWTALMVACNNYYPNPEIIQFLLDFGADRNLVNNKGKNALYITTHPNYGNPSQEIINILTGINGLENVKYITEYMNENCPICLETLGENYVRTTCGHDFHGDCLLYWKRKSNACPNCRTINSFFGRSKRSRRSKRSKRSKRRSKKYIFKI